MFIRSSERHNIGSAQVQAPGKQSLLLIPVLVLMFVASGCRHPYPPEVGRMLEERLVREYAETEVLDILYFTNRGLRGKQGGCSDSSIGVAPGPGLKAGICRVQVPRNHSVGALDQSATPGADGLNRFSILAGESLSDGYSTVDTKEAVVFIHGFNVKFEEAVLRAAQIQYDLKFPYPVILFSWPAGPSEDVLLESLSLTRTYRENQSNAARSIELFSDFLIRLSGEVQNMHLVVHSMGHQLVIPGIVRALEREPGLRFGEVVFFAPDFPADRYGEYGARIRGKAYRVTLYCSPGDNALVVSRRVNGNFRLGMCKRVPGVDVINVNEVDDPALGVAGLGHGYYSSRPIMTDLYQLFLGISVEKRLFIRKSDPGHGENYVLRK